jgi:peptidoglycan/LPS O-acetylase OafA/YrhL
MKPPIILLDTSRPARRDRSAGVAVALALLGWLALALTYLAPTAFRTFVVVAFVLIGPGAALTGYLRERDPVEELTLVLASSTACGALVAEAVYLAGVGSPRLVLVMLATLTTVLVAGSRDGIRRALRRLRTGVFPPVRKVKP